MDTASAIRFEGLRSAPSLAPAESVHQNKNQTSEARHIRILGIRGLPAKHGGFETFAERLAPYLVQSGWKVTVYCQLPGSGPITEDMWNGVRRVNIPSGRDTALNSVIFDWRSNLHARKEEGVCLTLGYNTGAFMALLKRKGIVNLINMDGIEYARAKWGPIARLWFRMNEWAAVRLADHLIADHPEIKAHLRERIRSKEISVIAYGSDALAKPPSDRVEELGLVPGKYLSVIARPEPENSLLEIVRAFSTQKRHVTLAVLGSYSDNVPYHAAVRAAASDEVRFLGAIYNIDTVAALRYHSLAYVHGHRVGGSNPSLIEAMGAGNAVIAHDNKFNRWVAGSGGCYFANEAQLSAVIQGHLSTPSKLTKLGAQAKARHTEEFTWLKILSQYERLIDRYVTRARPVTRAATKPRVAAFPKPVARRSAV